MLKFLDNYPLKNATTLQIGGPAKKFVVVESVDQLKTAIASAEKLQLPYLLIGGGSNLLVSDQGIDALVIKNEISGIKKNGEALKVNSGTSLQELIDYAINHGLSGLQKLTGIPGTVGGAVYGNAGAYGQTISDHINQVVILTPHQTEQEKNLILSKEKCGFNYRDSIFKQTKNIILEVTFHLERGNTQKLKVEAEEVLAKRIIKYPPGIKCPGSFFKNLVAAEVPAEILKNIPVEKIVYGKVPAGALLEEVGAKGQKLDGIEIASYHGNLFINKGAGTAKAFYELAKIYAQKVKEKFNITLEPEVQLINLPSLI